MIDLASLRRIFLKLDIQIRISHFVVTIKCHISLLAHQNEEPFLTGDPQFGQYDEFSCSAKPQYLHVSLSFSDGLDFLMALYINSGIFGSAAIKDNPKIMQAVTDNSPKRANNFGYAKAKRKRESEVKSAPIAIETRLLLIVL